MRSQDTTESRLLGKKGLLMSNAIEDVTDALFEATDDESVIAVSGESHAWVGTGHWCVRLEPQRQPTLGQIEALIPATMVPLAETDRVLERHEMPLVRVYERPDGKEVFLNRRYVKAIQRLAPFGATWHQDAEKPLGVCVLRSSAGTACAVLMPVRVS